MLEQKLVAPRAEVDQHPNLADATASARFRG
jgi:hypothetical protein